jgi:hypothetical protein
VFCHQAFHHLVDQEGAALFRHVTDVQRTSDEYLANIHAAGFRVGPSAISYPFLGGVVPISVLVSVMAARP